MADREKVIRELECVLDAMVQSEHAIAENGIVMSSWQDRAKRIDAIRDALALLKAQEPVKPIERNGFYYCGACRYAFTVHRQKYCSDCGRAVKWE